MLHGGYVVNGVLKQSHKHSIKHTDIMLERYTVT